MMEGVRDAGFEDGEKGSRDKNCRQPLEKTIPVEL